MRILLLSWYFPPTNTMGALRTGKLAQYLLSRGDDVRIITGDRVPRPQSLPVVFPEDRVVRTKWLRVNAVGSLPLRHFPWRGRPVPGQSEKSNSRTAVRSQRSVRSALSDLYIHLTNVPDSQIGWIPFALTAARRVTLDWRPDIIYATGPPFSSHCIAALLTARFWSLRGVPWLAELRDRWSDDPYYPPPFLRARVDHLLEGLVLSSASGLVTVSEPWARAYRERYRKPTMVVYNGYDPGDYEVAEVERCAGTDELRIVYTGRIYPGRRDPSPLFQAMNALGGQCRIRLDVYGTQRDRVLPLAARYGVSELVHVHSHVPYKESLALQAAADVLLLMQWNDAREQGNVPGKLFEYLAARRPLLGLGLETGVPASIITERSAGLFSNDPSEIAAFLDDLSEQKRSVGKVAELPTSVRKGFTRQEQFQKLKSYMQEFVGLKD